MPLYSVSKDQGATLNGFKLRALFAVPHADDRKLTILVAGRDLVGHPRDAIVKLFLAEEDFHEIPFGSDVSATVGILA